MYTLLILFSASLLAIIVMISRKLVLVQNGEIALSREEIFLENSYLNQFKITLKKIIEELSHKSLVSVLRSYVKSMNYLKNKYENLVLKKRKNGWIEYNTEAKKETSKFLKVIAEYKEKVRNIKHKIIEEENRF